ncbi:hypothetical protein AAVH_02964 [Aphelenchoides avenae]|nr:hypothetical protein AAVH_02964 [Aphelenchus avenae]
MAGPSVAGNDPAKLVEYLMSDLRNLSTEAKKKHNHVKEAAESGLVKVRNISTGSQPQSLLQNLRSACSEILHPLILGCSSKNPKLVQISLQAIQRMLQFRVVEASSTPVIVNELWHLTQAECEELRVLQTITPFVSTDLLVTDSSLAKCIVLAIKLNFSKDPSVINAASAAVRQLFSCVFERVIQEDGMKGAELMIVPQTVRKSTSPNSAPPTLRPCAADGYLLLKDLNSLVRKEHPTWLEGVRRITMPLALELLESVLKNYPSVFFKHAEYADLLKNQICPQVVRMFAGEKEIRVPAHALGSSASLATQSAYSGSISSVQSASSNASTARPMFPVMIRSLRIVLILISHYHQILSYQCEVLMNFLMELLSSEHYAWQAATALEVLHRIVGQPELLRWFCESKDEQANSTNTVQLVLSKLTLFIRPVVDAEIHEGAPQAFGQPGFLYKKVFVPLQENLSAKKWIM